MRQLDPCPKCGNLPVLLRTPKNGNRGNHGGYHYCYACLPCGRAARWLAMSISNLILVTYEWNHNNDYELNPEMSWERMVRKGVWVKVDVAEQKITSPKRGLLEKPSGAATP